MNLATRLALVVALYLVTAFPAGFLALEHWAVTRTDSANVRCEEDEPCWNCETMGNHVCGPVGD